VHRLTHYPTDLARPWVQAQPPAKRQQRETTLPGACQRCDAWVLRNASEKPAGYQHYGDTSEKRKYHVVPLCGAQTRVFEFDKVYHHLYYIT
jgi:hypothetical protein